jgi:hypothetical protein
MVVIDADTLDAERVQSQEREYFDLLAPAAKQQPFQLVQAVPELEIVFFESPISWETALGHPLQGYHVEDAQTVGRPHHELERLLHEAGLPSRTAFVERLDDMSVTELAHHQVFRRILDFLRHPKTGRRRNPA